MSDLLVVGGRVFVAAGDQEVWTPGLLTYNSRGGAGTYLRLSHEGFGDVVAIAARHGELVALGAGTNGPHGFTLRAFRVR